jgi:hypothetical protein
MAISITIDSNYDRISEGVSATLQKLIDDQEPFLIAIASSVLATVAHRIHTEGKRADGSPLGQYSNSYMKERRNWNRTEDRKVIASLTRQMENDFSVIAEGSTVGLGFKNAGNTSKPQPIKDTTEPGSRRLVKPKTALVITNLDKAKFIEGMYPGTYLLSAEEDDIIIEAANLYINDLFT